MKSLWIKIFALISLNWNFTEMIMIANKVIPANMVVVNILQICAGSNSCKFTAINPPLKSAQRSSMVSSFVGLPMRFSQSLLYLLYTLCCALRTRNNQMFRYYFVWDHYHVSKISARIIQGKFFHSKCSFLSESSLPTPPAWRCSYLSWPVLTTGSWRHLDAGTRWKTAQQLLELSMIMCK